MEFKFKILNRASKTVLSSDEGSERSAKSHRRNEDPVASRMSGWLQSTLQAFTGLQKSFRG